MMTKTATTPEIDPADGDAPTSLFRKLIGRITRLEILVGAAIAALMVVLVVIEPNILEAPFENERTLLFTVGGTVLAGLALVTMLWLRIPAVIRLTVLVVPFAIVNWWLLSPYFIDDVVDETFSTSISEQLASTEDSSESESAGSESSDADPGDTAPPVDDSLPDDDPSSSTTGPVADEPTTPSSEPADEDVEEPPSSAPPAPEAPVLLGAGQFVGLAGHDGTGDAGIFRNPDGSHVLRFENFDIENGPDLEVYLVPGADQTSLAEGSVHLGALEGNIGNQTYELPPGTELPPGPYTALVWCEAFSVEFVGATVEIAG